MLSSSHRGGAIYTLQTSPGHKLLMTSDRFGENNAVRNMRNESLRPGESGVVAPSVGVNKNLHSGECVCWRWGKTEETEGVLS